MASRCPTSLPRRRPSASRFRAPLTRWERKLRLDEDHRRAARELLMQKYNASKHGNDFLRPLVYPPMWHRLIASAELI